MHFLIPSLFVLIWKFLSLGTIALPQEITDHSATYVSILSFYEIQASYKRTIWLYSRANFELLNQKNSNYNWNILYNRSLDEACHLFNYDFYGFGSRVYPM